MSSEVLEYIGLDLKKVSKKLKAEKPEYNTSGTFDNTALYRVYKRLQVKDIQILISNSDRTTEIKERYELAKPLDVYLKENSKDFENLLDMAKVSDIKEIEKAQEEFQEKQPYFVKYDKNYIWQIYYSKEDDKYFMLFPTKESEVAVLFYMIKQKLECPKSKIYVPICKADYEETYFSHQEISDIENYIWLFTKEWPNIYEVEKEVYIIGKTKLEDGFESRYRIAIKSKEDADNVHTLLKALFILTTESGYNYNFEPAIDDDGNLVFKYKGEIVNIENLTDFISRQTEFQTTRKEELSQKVNELVKELEDLKNEVKSQNDIYRAQERQIVMFLDCKKSFFGRVKYFFKKTTIKNNEDDIKVKLSSRKKLDLLMKEKLEDSDAKEQKGEALGNDKVYTLADLIRACKENFKEQANYKNVKADINAMIIKKKNMDSKISNARKYLEEIEEHKKSIFEFWKFTKKDEVPELTEAEGRSNENKLKVSFNYEEDIQELAVKADILQKQKLSIDECNSIYACQYVIDSINSVVNKVNRNKVLENDLNELRIKYTGSKKTEIFGELEEDYTKIRLLGNNKHRENKKNIYSILKVNDKTTLEEYKNSIDDIVKLLDEAYRKITSVADFPVYFKKAKKGEYVLADIESKNLIEGNNSEIIYKTEISKDTHILYLSNITYYDNYNKTLPNGMDEGTKVVIKLDEIKTQNEKKINIVEQDGLYDINVRGIKVVEC